MKYLVVMTIRYNIKWLEKTREERNNFNDKYIIPIINKYSNDIKIRFFDAECFYAKGSDFFIFECFDLKKYYFMMEEMRDTELFSKDLLSVVDIMMGIEEGYKEFESQNEVKDELIK